MAIQFMRAMPEIKVENEAKGNIAILSVNDIFQQKCRQKYTLAGDPC